MAATENDVWTALPGLFDVAHGDAAPSAAYRSPEQHAAKEPRRGVGGLARRSAELVEWLRGYRFADVLCAAVEVWVPVVQLWPPLDGRASFKYSASRTRETTAELAVTPNAGFGTGSKVTLGQSIEIAAEDRVGRQYGVCVYVTVRRYEHPRLDPIDRVDVACVGRALDARTDDLSPELFPAKKRALSEHELLFGGFQEAGRYLARRSAPPGTDKYGTKASTESSWSFQIESPEMGPLKSSVTISVKTSRAASVEASFDLPRGHDYVFFHRTDETPLVPWCARLV